MYALSEHVKKMANGKEYFHGWFLEHIVDDVI